MARELIVEPIIGKRIQEIRLFKGITQQQLAEKIGVSTNYISCIERGEKSMRIDKLVLIVNALECSVDDIFIDVTNYGHTLRSSVLVERFENLSDRDQKRFLLLVDLMIKGEL